MFMTLYPKHKVSWKHLYAKKVFTSCYIYKLSEFVNVRWLPEVRSIACRLSQRVCDALNCSCGSLIKEIQSNFYGKEFQFVQVFHICVKSAAIFRMSLFVTQTQKQNVYFVDFCFLTNRWNRIQLYISRCPATEISGRWYFHLLKFVGVLIYEMYTSRWILAHGRILQRTCLDFAKISKRGLTR